MEFVDNICAFTFSSLYHTSGIKLQKYIALPFKQCLVEIMVCKGMRHVNKKVILNISFKILEVNSRRVKIIQFSDQQST